MRLYDYTDVAAFKLAALTSSAISSAASVATADWTMGVFGVPMSVFLAGFAGALVSLSFLPPPATDQDAKKTLLGMAGHVASGTVLAAFCEPLVLLAITHYFKPDEPLPASVHLGIAGLLGALLMVVLPIGIKYLKGKFGGGVAI